MQTKSGIRIWHNKKKGYYIFRQKGVKSRVLFFYDADKMNLCGINGVIGSIKNWCEILIPLLNEEDKAIEKVLLNKTNEICKTREDGDRQIRMWYNKRKARLLLKCSCCNEKVEIYHGQGWLKINGVKTTTKEWRKLFSRLL